MSLALDLNFAGAATLAGATLVGPTPVLTRSTTGTYIDSAGLLQTAAINAPRFDYDPSTLAAKGLLIEEARTNLLLRSNDLTNASWLKNNLTTAQTATGPDGVANSATTLTASAANGYANQSVTSASAARVSSLYIKRRAGAGVVGLSQGEVTGPELITNGTFGSDISGWTDDSIGTGSISWDASGAMKLLRTDGSNIGRAYQAITTVPGEAYRVDISNGAGATGAFTVRAGTSVGGTQLMPSLGAAAGVSASYAFVATGTTTYIYLTPSSNGTFGLADNISVKKMVETALTVTSSWTRVSCAAATITNPTVLLRLATSGDAVDVYGFQHEVGSFITSLIPTTTATVTRADDVVVITGTSFSNFWNASAGTLYAEFDSPASGVRAIVAADNNGTSQMRIRTSGAAAYFTVTDTTVTQCDITAGTVAAATFYKMAAAYAANDFAASIAGAAVATDTSGTVPTVDRMRLGKTPGERYMCGHIKRIRYWNARLSNADLVSLSGGGVYAEIPAASVTLTGRAPAVAMEIGAPVASLEMTPFAPALAIDAVLPIPASALAMTGYAPTFEEEFLGSLAGIVRIRPALSGKISIN